MKRIIGIIFLSMLAACAGIRGSGLIPGESNQEDVMRVMGPPAVQWANPDGSRQLAYPGGPLGVHTYMVQIGANGKLLRIENAMAPEVFMRVKPGMSNEEVLRLLGPSAPSGTAYFQARDELVWEWRYCDEWGEFARFDVLFDGTKKTVRSTMSLKEDQIGICGGKHGGCWCAR